MDELLQEMLEVERQAKELVRQAEAQAKKIVTEAQHAAVALEAEITAQTREEMGRILEERVAQAEAERKQRIQEAAKRLERKKQDWLERIGPAVEFVRSQLLGNPAR